MNIHRMRGFGLKSFLTKDLNSKTSMVVGYAFIKNKKPI